MDRAERVIKIREKMAQLAMERATNKRLKEDVEPVVHRKTGCNFCSHFRKKIIDGIALVKSKFE